MRGSYSLSTISGGRVLGVRVAMDSVPQVVVADLSLPAGGAAPGGDQLAWKAVGGLGSSAPEAVTEALENLEVGMCVICGLPCIALYCLLHNAWPEVDMGP